MPDVPSDTPDPKAHTPPLPSESPESPPPSRGNAPCISPPAPQALPPSSSEGVPAGSPLRSAPHTSAAGLHKPPPSHQASFPPAPQTAHECICPWDTLPSSRSTPPKACAALPPSTAAAQTASGQGWRRFPPVSSGNAPPSARWWLHQIDRHCIQTNNLFPTLFPSFPKTGQRV